MSAEPLRHFLDARLEAARQNREWSIAELGADFEILDTGCEILEHLAAMAGNTQPLTDRSAARAINFLSFFIASRGCTVASLVLDAYPTDAGALMRGAVEAHALQILLATDPTVAERWWNGEKVAEKLMFRAVGADTGVGRA